MVINDHDAVNTPGLSIFCNVWEVARISLPDLAEFIFFEGFAVTHVRVTCRFQVVLFDKALDSTDTDGGRDKGIGDQVLVNLGGIEPGKLFFEAVDLFDGSIREYPGKTFIRACMGHQCLQSAALVHGDPFFDGLIVILHNGTIRKREWRSSHAFVESSPGSIRIKILDDRCDDAEAELGDFGSFTDFFFVFIHGVIPP